MQIIDALACRYRLRHRSIPASWVQVDIRCPACGRFFVGQASPREDAREGGRAARFRLLRSCPNHAQRFTV